MIRHDLFLRSVLQVLQASFFLLQIDVAETPIEQRLTRIKFEFQAQLVVVDVVVSSEVQERVVEVCQGLLKVSHQEVRDALLKVCHSEVLV